MTLTSCEISPTYVFTIVNYHHHHVPEGLGVFLVPWSSRWSWSLHLFLGRPMFLRHFGLYCGACFGSLFVSILCTCCSHFFWYCFISFTMFCAPVYCLIHWFFSPVLLIVVNCIYIISSKLKLFQVWFLKIVVPNMIVVFTFLYSFKGFCM